MEPTGQAPGTPRPNRRRRKRVIVALLLVVALMVAWSSWPRGDARFVGTWDLVFGGDPCTLRLDRNGFARLSSAKYRSVPFRWTTTDNRMNWNPRDARFRLVDDVLFNIWFRFANRNQTTWVLEHSFEIVQVSVDRVELRNQMSGQVVILIRRLE
jgi:hypothetical protein